MVKIILFIYMECAIYKFHRFSIYVEYGFKNGLITSHWPWEHWILLTIVFNCICKFTRNCCIANLFFVGYPTAIHSAPVRLFIHHILDLVINIT